MGKRVAAIHFLFVVVLTQVGFVALLQAEEMPTDRQPATTSGTKSVLKKNDDKSDAANDRAAKDKIWNSADMLKARTWVDDYFRVTKKYTPEQKAEYKKHLASLTAPQMEMWLMRFDHDRLEAKKSEAGAQTARDARLARDHAELKQNQKSLRDIEKGENTAAANEEKRLKSEQTFARSMYRQKQRESSRMLEEYSSGGFGGGFGMGMR
ncbi:MAG: hypothetical protein OSA43_06415 [Pirellulales bacterium]|nr:hypothetical protein [Pirellulales bacterium]